MKTYLKKDFRWNFCTYNVICLEDGRREEFELLDDAKKRMYELVLNNVRKHYIIQKLHSIATVIE